MSLVFYAIAGISGMIIKIVDQIEDIPAIGKRVHANLKYLFALAYGLLLGYNIAFSSFSTIWLAGLFAQLFMGKIDKMSHFLGFSSALVITLIFGINQFSTIDFFILLAAACIDELKLYLGDARICLKLVALAYAFFRWDYFIAIIIFDAAYYITGAVFLRKLFK